MNKIERKNAMRRLKLVTEITQIEFFSQTEAKQSICLLMWPWERDMQEIRQTNLTDFDIEISLRIDTMSQLIFCYRKIKETAIPRLS